MSLLSLSSVSQSLLQSLQSTGNSAATDAQTGLAAIVGGTAATAGAGNSTTSTAAAPGVPHGHHHHGGFFQKIQSAVLAALKSAQSSGTTDPNTAVQTALTNVLSGNDPDGDGDGGTSSTSASTTQPQSAAEFFQTLQQYGITPEQFGQDFAAAAQAASTSGNQAVPTGLLVNTTA